MRNAMKCNVGGADRIIRFLIGVILILAGWYMLEGNARTLAIVIGAVVIFTALVRRCLLYYPLGISTCKSDDGS